MKNLRNIKKTYFEIAQLLAQNERLQRLLVLESDDPFKESFTSLTINELFEKKYISLTTPFLEEGIETNWRNMFLTIRFDDISFEGMNDNFEVRGAIVFGAHDNYVMLKDNKCRLLEIIDEVLKTLDDQKLSAAGKISVSGCTAVSFSPYVTGYRMSFYFSDLSSRKAEI